MAKRAGIASITVGDLVVTFEGEVLSVSRKDQPEQSIFTKLDAEGVEHLIEFLNGLPRFAEERRGAFRVPVMAPNELQVQVTQGAVSVPATAIDISVGGALLEIGLYDDVNLAINDYVDVKLAFEEVEVTLLGSVRRILARRYGVAFEYGPPAPPPLEHIVSSLRRRWLKRVKARL